MMPNSILVINIYRMTKPRLILTAVLLCAASIVYGADYQTIAAKASRFFAQKEWASASAMYDLMLEQQPRNCETYGYAIVSAGMRNDTTYQMFLMNQSINAHVSFDSTFTCVKRVSFGLGNSVLYEKFLIRVKRQLPWLSRNIDNNLLDYYVFRNDAAMMIHYSRKMLNGLPDDIRYLTILADGLIMDGQFAEGMATYEKILALDPNNYNALVQLGIYYQMTAKSVAAKRHALSFFERAHMISATPSVETSIKKLREEINGLK